MDEIEIREHEIELREEKYEDEKDERKVALDLLKLLSKELE